MTVAPRMPTASSTLSVPSKCGISPAANALRVDADLQQVVQEAEEDDREKAGDRELELAVPAGLQLEDRERDDRGHQAGDERRDAEEQVQRDRRADELREVGGDGDRLGLQPQPERHGLLEVLAAELRQVLAGRDARLGATGTGRASPSGSRRRSPTRACSRTWRRPRCWWRSCPGRCRRRRRRRPGRAGRRRPSRGRGRGSRAAATARAAARRSPPRAASTSVGGFMPRAPASSRPGGRRRRASRRRR